MTATTVPAEIVAFAASVRAALADLPADEVEELTDGLEADLAESYAEDLQRELTDPGAYAAELRFAAGLPTAQPRQGRLAAAVGGIVQRGRDLDQSLRQSPAAATCLDFLVSLRPAWWIVRGWAAYQCVGALFGFEGDLLPFSGFTWFVLAVLVCGSVFVGLRRWPSWMRVLIRVGNVVAVGAMIFGLSQVPTHGDLAQAGGSEPYVDGGYDGGGVVFGDSEVTNIFAYDATGKPISGIQLFDQDGRPLQTSVPGGNGCLGTTPKEIEECQTPGAWVPSTLETGAKAWNIYPMQMVESSPDDPTVPLVGATPQDRPAPFIKVPAILSATTDTKAGAVEPEKSR